MKFKWRYPNSNLWCCCTTSTLLFPFSLSRKFLQFFDCLQSSYLCSADFCSNSLCLWTVA
jgi:hypothetical protein